MRRRSHHTRALLLVATLLTVLTVAIGTLLTPLAVPASENLQLSAADSRVTTRVSGAEGNTGVTSRGGSRDLARGSATSLGNLSSYKIQKAAAPIEKLPPYKIQKAAAPIEKLPPGPVPGDPFTFQIGTLNIQGSQHRAGGTTRASMLAGAITGRGVDLVGLQEVQDDQLAVLQNQLPGYTIWPGQALGNQGVRLQIAFRSDLFELVDTGSIITTFDNQARPIPYVLLRDRATTGEFYVIDVHNSPRGQEVARDSATGAQISLINTLRSTGKPVFIIGDTNEHTEFACRVMASTGMVGSSGANASGGCYAGSGPVKIDWILGAGGVAFSGHAVDYASPIRASTDHAFVHSTVTVTPLVPAGTE